jgi:hypothetical protein
LIGILLFYKYNLKKKRMERECMRKKEREREERYKIKYLLPVH